MMTKELMMTIAENDCGKSYVKRHASTDTKAKFKKRVFEWLKGDAERELRRQKERKEEAVQA